MIRICIKHLCGLFFGVLVSAPRLYMYYIGITAYPIYIINAFRIFKAVEVNENNNNKNIKVR